MLLARVLTQHTHPPMHARSNSNDKIVRQQSDTAVQQSRDHGKAGDLPETVALSSLYRRWPAKPAREFASDENVQTRGPDIVIDPQ